MCRLAIELVDGHDADTRSWAHRALVPAKDALAVVAAFTASLTRFGDPAPVSGPEERKANAHRRRPRQNEPGSQEVTVIGKPIRERDRDQLRFVTAQPCLICGRTPLDPHHIKFAEERAMALRVSDRFTVRSAGCTIANFTGGATSAPGGRNRESILWSLPRACGRRRMRPHQRQLSQPTSIGQPTLTEAISLRSFDLKMTKRSQFLARTPDDLFPANRGQPQYRTRDRGG
jgi:hypothetical protein